MSPATGAVAGTDGVRGRGTSYSFPLSRLRERVGVRASLASANLCRRALGVSLPDPDARAAASHPLAARRFATAGGGAKARSNRRPRTARDPAAGTSPEMLQPPPAAAAAAGRTGAAAAAGAAARAGAAAGAGAGAARGARRVARAGKRAVGINAGRAHAHALAVGVDVAPAVPSLRAHARRPAHVRQPPGTSRRCRRRSPASRCTGCRGRTSRGWPARTPFQRRAGRQIRRAASTSCGRQQGHEILRWSASTLTGPRRAAHFRRAAHRDRSAVIRAARRNFAAARQRAVDAVGDRAVLTDILCCPRCAGTLAASDGGFRCERCGGRYPVFGRIPCLVEDPSCGGRVWLRRLDDYTSTIESRVGELQREAERPIFCRARGSASCASRTDSRTRSKRSSALFEPLDVGTDEMICVGDPEPARAGAVAGDPRVLRAPVPRLGVGRARVRADARLHQAARTRRPAAHRDLRRGRRAARGRRPSGVRARANARAGRQPAAVPGRGQVARRRDGRPAGIPHRPELRRGRCRGPPSRAPVRPARRFLFRVRRRASPTHPGGIAGRGRDLLVHRRGARRSPPHRGRDQPRAAPRRSVGEPGPAAVPGGVVARVHDRGGARDRRRQRVRASVARSPGSALLRFAHQRLAPHRHRVPLRRAQDRRGAGGRHPRSGAALGFEPADADSDHAVAGGARPHVHVHDRRARR